MISVKKNFLKKDWVHQAGQGVGGHDDVDDDHDDGDFDLVDGDDDHVDGDISKNLLKEGLGAPSRSSSRSG